MKKATYILSILIACVFVSTQLKAQTTSPTTTTTPPPAATAESIQDYQIAGGLKFGGYENGISGKYFMVKDIAIEGIIGFRQHGVVVTGLYEIHQVAFNVPELKFYYGAGAHVGSVGAGVYKRFNGDDAVYISGHLLLGLDGVLGLEYIIPKSPIAISLDLNPRFEVATGPFFDIAPGLGVKYIFR